MTLLQRALNTAESPSSFAWCTSRQVGCMLFVFNHKANIINHINKTNGKIVARFHISK